MEDQPTPKPQLPEVGLAERPPRDAGKKTGRRRLFLAVALAGVGGYVLLVGVILFVYFHRPAVGPTPVPDNPRATEANFDRIVDNMTKEEVEQILGPGHKVSRAEVFYVLHEPLPPEGVGSDTLTLKWQHQGDIILVEFLAPTNLEPNRPPGKPPERSWMVIAGWFVREQGEGKKPRYKLLGMDKLP